jgi:hypothetical protein
VLFGLISRPGFLCLRAAVASYLFHCSVMLVHFLQKERGANSE